MGPRAQAVRALIVALTVSAACAARAEDAKATDPWREHALGVAYLDENAPAKAVEHLERAAAALPDELAPLHDLAVAYLRAGRSADALAAASRLCALVPDDSAPYYVRGVARKREERWADAAAELARATERNPDDPPAHFHLGVALRKQGKLAEARAALERAVKLDPGFASAWYQLSTLAREAGDGRRADEALAAFEAVRTRIPLEEMTPEALDRGNLARPRHWDPGAKGPPLPRVRAPWLAEAPAGLADWDNDGDLELPTAMGLEAATALPVDADRDGWIDAVTLAPEVRFYRNVSGTALVAAGPPLVSGAASRARLEPHAVLVEIEGKTLALPIRDGAVARAAAPAASRPLPAPVRGPPGGDLAVRPVGAYSNKMGLGATIEVRAGALVARAFIDGPPPVYFDLAGRKADTIHIVWPNGTSQAVIDPKPGADRVVTVIEKGRQKTSCPLLFTWNGERFEFVTDMLGAAFIGILVAPPDQYYQPDRDEVVRIPPRALVPRGEAGALEVRIAEQLEEVTYLDRVELLAVEHDVDTEAYPHEQLRLGPPWPEFFVCDARAPREVPFSRRGFEPLRFTGFTTPWTLEMDLGDVASAPHAHLLVDGWLRYWNSTSAYEAARNGVPFLAPRLEAEDGRVLIADLGMPAGLPKTMVLDVTKVRVPRLRIRANQEVYVDRIRLCTAHGARPPAILALAPKAAELGRTGYFRLAREKPAAYDYNRRDEVGFLGRLGGRYTRFGDVTRLLAAGDDRFVVFGPGEEVAVAFDGRALPPLAAGRTRTFFLRVEGYCKEMDPHTAHGRTVEPLPFRAMTRYPYAEGERAPARSDELRTREERGSAPIFARE